MPTLALPLLVPTLVLGLTLLLACSARAGGNNISFPELLDYDPVADPAAVVTSGPVAIR